MAKHVCVFCDGELRIVKEQVGWKDRYFLRCRRCGRLLFGYDTKEAAEAALNSKADSTDNSRLKPCHRCGSENVELYGSYLFGVTCNDCGLLTSFLATREEAIEAWNRRA